MSTSSSSAILADALSVLSKTTHQILADTEARSRSEVARATANANEARHQRDDALKELRPLQLEVQELKATLAQAELRITHQLDTLNQNAETITQLRREVNQWKDQSKNWQEHFLRVEQERCALSSRIDELVSERVQWCRNASAVHTPRSRYQEGLVGASGSSKREEQPSPMQSSAHKAPLPPNDVDVEDASLNASTSKEKRKPGRHPGSGTKKSAQHTHSTPANVDSPLSHVKTSSSQNRNIDSSRTANHQSSIRSSTVIRRVQAVVHVKQEESDEEPGSGSEPNNPPPSGEIRVRRRRSRMVVEDPQDDADDSDDGATVARSLRATKAINYEESDFEEQESEEDELMIGNRDKREEALGSSASNHRSKTANGPPMKKRKKGS